MSKVKKTEVAASKKARTFNMPSRRLCLFRLTSWNVGLKVHYQC